jgi:hypothetical protein
VNDSSKRKAVFNGNSVIVKQLPVTLKKVSDGEKRFMKTLRALLEQRLNFSVLKSTDITRFTDADVRELKLVILYSLAF